MSVSDFKNKNAYFAFLKTPELRIFKINLQALKETSTLCVFCLTFETWSNVLQAKVANKRHFEGTHNLFLLLNIIFTSKNDA